MKIASGVTDQYIYFVAVDATDLKTREPGLSSFTVYRSRNGAAAVAMTTPTVNEVDATNMPGVYELLLDEDMTIGAGNDTEEMCFHITATGMDPVTRVIELFRPKITAGNTLGVAADGDISGNVDGTLATVTNLTNLPSIPANWLTAAGIAAGALDGKGDWNVGKTGYTLTVQDWNTTTPPTAAAIRSEIDSNSSQLAAIVGDTAELQGDWVNGGRLDLILDAINAKLPAALVGGRIDANMSAINNSNAAAAQLALSAATIEDGACEGTPTTTVIQTDLAETQNDVYIGRTIIFTSGAAQGEASDITDYVGSTGTLTVTALASAPSSGDTFIII